ncbi:MAG: exodeoxyribonuclease VII small subunit [Proteobacteria bacterium]|nr:exodeoxyribonuclease VII small subunit [Pseudomonadota bacterium]
MSKDKDNKKEPTFEEGLIRLEGLLEKLEGGELDLDRSLAVFEEGIMLTRKLNRKLDEAEKKLELLIKNENGLPETRDFDLTPDDQGEA